MGNPFSSNHEYAGHIYVENKKIRHFLLFFASAGQCLLRVVVVVVIVVVLLLLVGKKFKIGPKKPDTALVHFITFAGNEK